MSNDIREGIAQEVLAEREAQLGKWGTQSHAAVYGPQERREHVRAAIRWKAVNDARVAEGTGTPWSGILAEEFHEACAEEEMDKVREELIQVAAVAVAWVEDIDRATAEIEEAASQAWNIGERRGDKDGDL